MSEDEGKFLTSSHNSFFIEFLLLFLNVVVLHVEFLELMKVQFRIVFNQFTEILRVTLKMLTKFESTLGSMTKHVPFFFPVVASSFFVSFLLPLPEESTTSFQRLLDFDEVMRMLNSSLTLFTEIEVGTFKTFISDTNNWLGIATIALNKSMNDSLWINRGLDFAFTFKFQLHLVDNAR